MTSCGENELATSSSWLSNIIDDTMPTGCNIVMSSHNPYVKRSIVVFSATNLIVVLALL